MKQKLMKQKLKKLFENAVWWSGVVMVGLILGVSLQVVKAWTEPTEEPPGGNVGAPINTGSLAQIKSGVLGVLGLSTYSINIPGTIPAAGNVLTAQNASGQVAWAAAEGGGGGEKYALSCSSSGIAGQSYMMTICCRMDNLSGQTECKVNYDWHREGWRTFRDKPW